MNKKIAMGLTASAGLVLASSAALADRTPSVRVVSVAPAAVVAVDNTPDAVALDPRVVPRIPPRVPPSRR